MPTVEEAKRRRREQEEEQRRKQPPKQPRPNGHDPHGRQLLLEGWHELGEPEAQDSLIAGIVGPQQLLLVYGESGSGKSFLTFDAFAHYALGWEWMGHKVKTGAVLYIAAEGRGGWANRVEAFCLHHDIDEERRATVPFKFIRQSINLGRTGNGDVQAVIEAAKRFTDQVELAIDFIAVDTVARATPGANENDAGDMGAFVANMDAIRTVTKGTVALVHHSGKNAALGARGHSSLRAAVDAELEVERSDSGRVLKIRKSRDGNDGGDQGFGLKVVEIGRGEDGAPITSCVIEAADGPVEGRRKTRDKAAWQLAIDFLNNTLVDHPVTHGLGSAFPPNATITSVAKFREALERGSIIDGETPSSRRVQWKRLKDKLVAKGLLRIENDFCWRPDA